LRVIVRTDEAQEEDLFQILVLNDINFTGKIECEFYPASETKEIELFEDETIITTSWWTTQVILNSGQEGRIVYLLQEDERMFYPSGDDALNALFVMKNRNIRFILNGYFIYKHLISEGFDNIRKNGMCFEPAFNSKYFFRENLKEKEKFNFFFYARPHHARNIFQHGIKIIRKAIEQNILDPKQWVFNFVGVNVSEELIPENIEYNIFNSIPWQQYSEIARATDLGLVLITTPQPAYPIMDIAVCGGVVVTNKWGVKENLSGYSKNIVCCDIEEEALLSGLEMGVSLSLNSSKRYLNYKENKIPQDWEETLKSVIAHLAECENEYVLTE